MKSIDLEEAVNEVKRQAIAELQKAIAATDYKVTDFASSHLPNKAPTAEIKKPLVANPEHEFTGHNGFLSGDKLENSAFSPLQKNVSSLRNHLKKCKAEIYILLSDESISCNSYHLLY